MSQLRTTGFAVLSAAVLGMGLVSCSESAGQDKPIDAVPSQPSAQTARSEAAERTAKRSETDSPEHKVAKCYNSEDVYSGTMCFNGGSWTMVVRVIDGDTVKLADGRIVQLLGVDAPETDTCAGPGATEFTRSKVEGRTVKLIREPAIGLDPHGRTLAYIQYSESGMSSNTFGTVYGSDLGDALTLQGWATPDPGFANAIYTDTINASYATARNMAIGMNAAPCGSPDP